MWIRDNYVIPWKVLGVWFPNYKPLYERRPPCGGWSRDTPNFASIMMTSSGAIFSALLAFCAGNSPVTGEFPTQRPVTRSFDICLDLHLNKRLSKNRDAGDLRRHRAHYDVIIMMSVVPWNKEGVAESYPCMINVSTTKFAYSCQIWTWCVIGTLGNVEYNDRREMVQGY